jgi:hypothetical protein
MNCSVSFVGLSKTWRSVSNTNLALTVDGIHMYRVTKELSDGSVVYILYPWQRTFDEKPSQRHDGISNFAIFVPGGFQMFSEADKNIIQSRSVQFYVAWQHLLADGTPPSLPFLTSSIVVIIIL